MNTIYPKWTLLKKPVTTLFTWLLFLLISSPVFAQLGTYSFTGPGACPNQNHSVTSQPANAVFSDFTLQGIDCDSEDNMFKTKNWTPVSSVNLSEYLQFEITPSAGYGLNLTDLTFTHYVDELPGSGSTNWVLRSSIDNYSTDIATGISTTITQTSTVNLPVGDFTSIGTVIFRIYLLNIKGSSTRFFMDEVNLNGSIVSLPADPANPTSNSPQCYTTGVTMNFSGTPPSAEAWYWQTSANGTSTANSASSYNVTSSGTYYVKARDMSTLMWSAGAGSVYVIAIPAVYTPVFDLGSSSSRCSGSSAITFSATAQYSTNISYSLDAASISGGNTINDSTGQVNFSAGWTDTSVITATATGCDASTSTADHIVTITPNVGTPVFTAGATSFRCTGSGSFTYNASATNNLGISYSLDATSLAGGVTINASTGTVTYPLNWVGVSTITASAAGCNGPAISTHQASSLNPVVTPVFSGGGSSTICQGSGRLNYSATATNAVSISYNLDATSIAGGNTINTTIGDVIYAPSWSGTSYITATATGCGGPKSATHVVTITPTVGTPVFALGTTSTRCQGATNVVYGATASNSTVITYSLDAGSTAAGNIIDATGQVTYVAGWSGSSVITATAVGCNGPTTATHTATTTATVGTPVFNMGTTSTRCQGPGTVTYTANATNSTALSYSLNAAAITAGNTIDALTGQVSYVAGWTGSTIITASAAGCNGPITAQHTVTIDLTVGSASFVLGASSSRCGGAGSITYTATATNNTGITYSLDAASIAQGNTINSSTGTVSYVPAWSGPSTITASAAGCNGPSTASHTVNMLPGVTTPVFSLGTSSVRCQSTSNVTYTATATNSTGITYSLDAASVAGGNTINSSTGLVSYVSGWSGTTIITASAAGCSGPATATHTVTITPFVGTPVFVLGANSIRCQGAVTIIYTANASNSTGINYSLDAISLGSGNTINSSTGAVTFTVLWFGNSTITATATGCGSNTSATHTVTVNATVGTPVFTLGASSTRCQLGITVIYTATAANNSGITYSLDAASIAGGNTINAATGAVTYSASWTGTSTITATATGCNGPKTANHIVNTTPTVGVPSFIIGPVSSRCQGAGTATYTANASNATGMIYSLDVASITGGNSINSSTGLVTYAASWSGTTTVTATAAGCNGPKTNFHTVTITANVGNPVFTLGATSTRCQGAGTVTYTATATNNTGISYSLDAASISGGNSINSATGTVTYVAGWNGTSIIRASTTGCNGPQASNHTVTNTPTVGTPSFALGLFSSRQQGAATITYTASATNATGITYTLDAASLGGGNTINSSTGAVTYAVNWNGTTVITASAAGCNGPFTANHTVFINPTVVGIPLYLSDPSQALDRIDPVSTGDNTTASTLNLRRRAERWAGPTQSQHGKPKTPGGRRSGTIWMTTGVA